MRTKLDQSVDLDLQRRIQSTETIHGIREQNWGSQVVNSIGRVKIRMLNQTSFERRIKANVGRLRVRTNSPEVVSIVIGDQLHMSRVIRHACVQKSVEDFLLIC